SAARPPRRPYTALFRSGQAEPDEPALLAGLLRIGGQYLAGGLAEASELRFLSDQHGGGLGLLLQDAAEAGGQLGEALVDLLELIPLLRGELRPSPAELAAPVGHERGLLAALLDLGPLVDPLDALPQRFVEVELGEVLRQWRGNRLLHVADLRGGHRA